MGTSGGYAIAMLFSHLSLYFLSYFTFFFRSAFGWLRVISDGFRVEGVATYIISDGFRSP